MGKTPLEAAGVHFFVLSSCANLDLTTLEIVQMKTCVCRHFYACEAHVLTYG